MIFHWWGKEAKGAGHNRHCIWKGFDETNIKTAGPGIYV